MTSNALRAPFMCLLWSALAHGDEDTASIARAALVSPSSASEDTDISAHRTMMQCSEEWAFEYEVEVDAHYAYTIALHKITVELRMFV